MRSITKQLDMSPGAISPVVHVSQYDSDFTIVFNLYCTDGTFTLESGTTAEVRGTKKSGTGYSASATVNISAKTVTVTGDKQMTAVAGDNIYEITLYKGSKELNSINFILAVERAAMDQDTVVDETTIREFGELKTYIEDVKADTAASASAAQASQTAAANSASASAQSAIEAAQSAQSVDAERLNRIAFGSYVVEESTGPIAHFEDGADDIPMKDVLVHIEPVQAGSGDPSPDNVRAITGWTAAKVTRAGKNLLTLTRQSLPYMADGITWTKNDDGSVTANGTATNNAQIHFIMSDGNTFNPAGTYRFGGCPDGGANFVCDVYPWDNTENARPQKTETNTQKASSIYNSRSTETFYLPANHNMSMVMRVFSGQTVENLTFYPFCVPDGTDASWSTPVGQTYSITFPSEAGTVYGGTLDVTSGVLTVKYQKVIFDGTQTGWVASGTGYRYYSYNSFADGVFTSDKNVVCNYLKNRSYTSTQPIFIQSGATGNRNIYIYNMNLIDSSIVDVASLLAYLTENPLEITYKLATPQTYQLSPQEITSMFGENNLWADTGDSEVEYRADTKIYMDAKVAAAVSALT